MKLFSKWHLVLGLVAFVFTAEIHAGWTPLGTVTYLESGTTHHVVETDLTSGNCGVSGRFAWPISDKDKYGLALAAATSGKQARFFFDGTNCTDSAQLVTKVGLGISSTTGGGGGGTTPTTGLTDDFTNTNGTRLNAHSSNWTKSSNSQAYSQFTIQGNKLQINPWKNLRARFTGSSGDSSQLTILAPSTKNMGVGVRMSVDGVGNHVGYHVSLRVPTGGNFTRLEFTKSGGWLDHIGGLSLSQSANHVIKLVATDIGNTVSLAAYVDGVLVHTAVDSSSPLQGGLSGVVLENQGVASLVDDWSEG